MGPDCLFQGNLQGSHAFPTYFEDDPPLRCQVGRAFGTVGKGIPYQSDQGISLRRTRNPTSAPMISLLKGLPSQQLGGEVKPRAGSNICFFSVIEPGGHLRTRHEAPGVEGCLGDQLISTIHF